MINILDTAVIFINTLSIIGMVLIFRSVRRSQYRQKTMLNNKSSKIEVFQIYMATIFYLATITSLAVITTIYVLTK